MVNIVLMVIVCQGLTALAIGIHIGRTHSQIGVIRNKTFEMIADGQNQSLIPSYVAFTDEGPPLVGFAAKEQAKNNPQGTIYNVR